jgi:surface protein
MFTSTNIYNKNISSWNVINVTSFLGMFLNAIAFNNGGQTLYWTLKNTGSITMANMFNGALVFNQDIIWNSVAVTNMYSMFNNAGLFNGDVSTWDVSNVTDFSIMFANAYAFNQNVSSWNVSNAKNFYAMFSDAHAFNQNVGSWSVTNVTDFTYMFQAALAFNNGAAALTSNTLPLTWSLNTTGSSKTVLVRNMFYDTPCFSQDISSWNINNVSSMVNMFDLANTSMTSFLFNKMLIAWAAQSPIPSSPFTFSTIKYTSGGTTALTTLTSAPNSWTITARLVTYTPTSVNWGETFSLVYTVASVSSVSGHVYKLVNSKNNSVISTFNSAGQASFTFDGVVLRDYKYSSLYIIDTSANTIVDLVNINTIFPCLKEGTKILTNHGYIPIENLRKGDLVKTPLNEYIPIYMIGKKEIYNHALPEREKHQLYKCTPENYPEVFEDLILTGCHSILVDDFVNEEQRKKTLEINNDIFITKINCGTYMSGKYRLPACVDERAVVYDNEAPFTIYHIALENDNYYNNYGI